MSPEDAFRRVLTARLPAGPGWTAWIDGTVHELAASVEGVVLSPDEAATAARAVTRYAHEEIFEEDAQRLYDLADRMGGAR